VKTQHSTQHLSYGLVVNSVTSAQVHLWNHLVQIVYCHSSQMSTSTLHHTLLPGFSLSDHQLGHD